MGIKNGSVVTPNGIVCGGIGVQDGKIVYVGSDHSLPQSKRIINAQGKFVIPGLLDPHVHLAGGKDWPTVEEGLRAQFSRETEGALHGGVTTLGHFLRPPLGTSVTSLLDVASSIGEELSYIDFIFHAYIIDVIRIAEQAELFQRGVTSFKHFFNAYTVAERRGLVAPFSEEMLFLSFESIARLGSPAIAMCHCEDSGIAAILMERLQKAGRNDLRAWTESRPNFVEHIRIAHAVNIAKATGCPLYVVHVSTAEGSEIINDSRRKGYLVWGETCPHYLTHTADMESEIGCWGKVNPSLKYAADNEALWRQIRSGGITSLATDHAAVSISEKERQGKRQHNNIWESRLGICGGMEHMLPIMMTFGVNAGRISIEDMVRVCSTNTAKTFGIYPRKGALCLGSDADIVIVDPSKEAVIDEHFYHCEGGSSIYRGWKVKGMAEITIVRGEVMMEHFQTVGRPGYGKYISRNI